MGRNKRSYRIDVDREVTKKEVLYSTKRKGFYCVIEFRLDEPFTIVNAEVTLEEKEDYDRRTRETLNEDKS